MAPLRGKSGSAQQNSTNKGKQKSPPKRKHQDTCPQVSINNQEYYGSAATGAGSEIGSPGQASVSSITGQIEKDGTSVSNSVAEPNHHLASTAGAVGGEPCNSNATGMQNGGHSLSYSTANLSQKERYLIDLIAYSNDMSPENVFQCMLNLNMRGVAVTKDSLFEETFLQRPNLANKSGQMQSFPRRYVSNEASETVRTTPTESSSSQPQTSGQSSARKAGGSASRKTPVGHQNSPTQASAGSATRTTPAASSGQSSSAQKSGGSTVQRQNSTNLRDTTAQPGEDTVDGMESSSGDNSRGVNTSAGKPSSPAAAYHNKVNNVSSHSSAKDIVTQRDSSVDPPRAAPSAAASGEVVSSSTTVQHGQAKAMASPNQSKNSSGRRTVGATSTVNYSSATVQDSPDAPPDATNDLNKESTDVMDTEAEAVSDRPLKERDPAKYLATCLRLVRDEYKRLDIARHCGECGNNPRDITFLPCGHVWACRSCAVPLYVCPCCSKNIIATVDTYMC